MKIITLGSQKIGHEFLTATESQALLELCLDDTEKLDNSSTLVGVVSEQICLTRFSNIFHLFLDSKVKNYALLENLPVNFYIKSCWYNIMRPGDFNPLHDHTGDLSFIVTFEPSKALYQEQKSEDHRGRLWFYAPSEEGLIVGFSSFIGKSSFYIFRSTLDHAVYPFETDTVRYSLAGNLFFNNK